MYGKKNRNKRRLLSVLLMLCMTAVLLPVFSMKASAADLVEVIIPIIKTIEVDGEMIPGPREFEFEIAPNTEGVDISSLTITGNTIYVGEEGFARGTLNISGSGEVFAAADGLRITEKNDGAAGWSYDDSTYIVWNDMGNGMLIQKDMGPDADPETVREVSFVNTYNGADPEVNVTVDFNKNVIIAGNVDPEPREFQLEIVPNEDGADISDLTIRGNSFTVRGGGITSGELTITGSEAILTAVHSLRVTEKNDGAAGWIYDNTTYIIWYDARTGVTIQKDMGPDMNPETVDVMEFTNTYEPESSIVTVEIPVSKKVVQEGDLAPAAKTAEFEIVPGDPEADISTLTITGTSIETNGAGNYTGVIKITGEAAVIDAANGLILVERNDEAADWKYDPQIYTIWRDAGNGMLIQKDLGPDMNPESVETASFTNTYNGKKTETPPESEDPPAPEDNKPSDPGNNKPSEPEQPAADPGETSPSTGTDTQIYLWVALLAVSFFGAAAAIINEKKHSR